MLLPSAFPCDGLASTAPRPTRPQLPSFSAYTPLPKTATSSDDPTLASSCRALHSILGNPLRAPRPPPRAPARQLRNPFGDELATTPPRSPRATIPRGAKKRGRDEFEADLQNTHYGASTSEHAPDTNILSTPKRRRRIPLDMPLGLSAADFQSLDAPPVGTQNRHQQDHDGDLNMPELSHDCLSDSDDDVDSGYGPSNGPSPTLTSMDGPAWSVDDDRILVETVLEKLQLSKRAWNDCARRLGKDRDSIGRRWKALVDEGAVGLKIRRGKLMRRTSMEVPGW
ncbi:uncharacterized protein HMPREF1541_05142 [Cyphellophora europaea CBS 101466]|uniref:Myb-like domain-containing protein n=1 Tax=Cyphellophora europaea (strain CBS 101466) TaxID=1220924 RepID=W2RWS7_CYPE1|nr:uncharacterized protein HMPREF1541_05142 [Cyphellophora europaea CBS 101466]ETN40862.1 hypothetical protein HMPREF1541_05142 [Cyphellophora europaea CBS 101466]